MKRIFVDMDGVLADVYSQFLKFEFEETGKKRTMKETEGMLEADAFPYFKKHVQSPGFFRSAPIMNGSIEGLKYLNNKYEVIILSSATEFPISLTEKVLWLNQYYPFITWQQMVFCGRKDIVSGDIMIDDHPKNLDTFSGEKILFTQPHNIHLDMSHCLRVNHWDEIVKIL